MRAVKKILYVLLILFFLSVMAFSGYQIYNILSEYKEGEDIYEELEDGFKVKVTQPQTTESPVEETGTEKITEAVDESESTEMISEAETEGEMETEEMTEEETRSWPDYSEYEHQEGLFLFTIPFDYVLTPQYALDFENLLKLNSEVKGWITIEGTNIDYPVVQADNNTYYLRKTIDHKDNNAGSIFVECLVEAPFRQKNTIVYGHNQKNKRMFHELVNYQDREYYQEHPLIDIYTPDGQHQIYEIYSAYLTETGSATYQIHFKGEQGLAAYLDYTKEQSFYETNVAVNISDTILTLSTCTNDMDTERMIVHARLFTTLTQ